MIAEVRGVIDYHCSSRTPQGIQYGRIRKWLPILLFTLSNRIWLRLINCNWWFSLVQAMLVCILLPTALPLFVVITTTRNHSLRLVSFCTQTPRFEEWELFADLSSETGLSTPTSCCYLCGRTAYNYGYLRRRSGEWLTLETSLSFVTLWRWIFEPCQVTFLARYEVLVSDLPPTPHHSFLWNYLSFVLSEISKSWNSHN